MLKAVIFDFDGVISDTEPTHLQAFNKVLAEYNIEISGTDYYKKYLGLNDYEGFKEIARAHNLELGDEEIEDLVAQKGQVFEGLVESSSCIIEGAAEFIAMLKQNGIKMAICSGAVRSDIDAILSGMELPKFFEVIVTADDVKASKPDPAGFNMTLKKLNEKLVLSGVEGQNGKILPAECVVVEDSPWGLEAARRADMHTLAVTNSYTAQELKTAEKVADNLSKITITELQELCA
jgi:beta-phosphoglucomutase